MSKKGRTESRPVRPTGHDGSLLVAALALAAFGSTADGRPYGLRHWTQVHNDDYEGDYNGRVTDLFTPDGHTRLHYEQLSTPICGVYRSLRELKVYDWSTVPRSPDNPNLPDLTEVRPFNDSDYEAIIDGRYHCAPTAFGMIHDYWSGGGLDEILTIRDFAGLFDTNDMNLGNNNNDRRLHLGTYVRDAKQGVEQRTPPDPWPGNYNSDTLWWTSGDVGPTLAERRTFYGEIRAGRAVDVNVPEHATTGVDWSLHSVLVHDPATGSTDPYSWDRVRSFVSMQPQHLADCLLNDSSCVYFSNDNFGTGQANAQAPGGDPGDIFGSLLDGFYGRAWDDASLSGDKDYNIGTVTNGCEYPFDIDALDVLKTIESMPMLTYSLDHGDPNPHDWIPGLNEGNPSYQPAELMVTPMPTPWFTSGSVWGQLSPVGASEGALGFNRAEAELPEGPLDDDVDAVDLEWDPDFAFSVDYLDTRIFPEYEATAGDHWHQLDGWDPTDIYFSDGGRIDGETVIGLSELTDIDAIQFFSLDLSGTLDGLLFSIDLDAPELLDAWGRVLSPGDIYLSWLDGSPPSLWSAFGGWHEDLDAITWSVPAPATASLLALALAASKRRNE